MVLAIVLGNRSLRSKIIDFQLTNFIGSIHSVYQQGFLSTKKLGGGFLIGFEFLKVYIETTDNRPPKP